MGYFVVTTVFKQKLPKIVKEIFLIFKIRDGIKTIFHRYPVANFTNY